MIWCRMHQNQKIRKGYETFCFFIGQLPLKENHIVDLEQTRRIVNGSVPFSEVDTYMDYLLKGLSTQKLLLEKEDGSYEVNTKYEKSVIKVRKIARAFQLEKEKALEAGIPKAKRCIRWEQNTIIPVSTRRQRPAL